MNRKLILLAVIPGIFAISIPLCAVDKPWTPTPGTAERVAICDAARAFTMKNYVSPEKLPQPLVFDVQRMVVLGNYCYLEAFPEFKDGSVMGTDYIMDIEFEFCLSKNDGKWRVVRDLSRTDVPDDKELKQMRRDFPRDFPLAILPGDWRKRLERGK